MKRPGRALYLLLVLLSSTISPAAWAVLCSEVWPVGNGLNQYVPPLVLPNFNANTVLVASNPRTVPVGDSYWLGGDSATNWNLIAPTTGTARVYVKGDLLINNNARINADGNARNLILIVVGNLTIENSNNTRLNALIYATGNVVIGNNPTIEGGVSAAGSLSRGNNITYDSGAIAGTDFGGLCDNPDAVGQIDHYRFEHAASGLSCNPLDVTLRACADTNCTRLYEGSINATLNPSTWEGGNQRYFTGGQTLLKLRGVGEVVLGIAAVTPAANNPLRCDTPGCKVYFAEAGLLVQAPDLIAGKPDTLTVTAASGCVAAFANVSRPVQFWSTYETPKVGSLPVLLGGGAISSSPTSLTLNFNASGQASLPLSYADAGRMQIDARYVGSSATGDSGSSLSGSDTFVSRPYGLHISTPADSTCSSHSVAGCSVLRMAGDSFPLNIRAVAWQADGEALSAAALSDNPTTPSFELGSIGLSAILVAPTPGVAGTFYRHHADGSRSVLASYDHVLGITTNLTVSQSEVGIFRLSATPPAYHGQTVNGGESALIGRFTPAYLGVTSTASLTPACGAFSYQGQTINFAGGQPGIVATGYNRQGAITNNYDREPFWRLTPPERQAYSFSDTSKPGLVSRLQSMGDPQSLAVADSGGADGSRAFDWRAEGVRLADALQWRLPSPPTAEDLPFVLSAAGEHVQLKVAAAELTDLDGICYRGSDGSAATCQDFAHAFGGTEVRLGRLRIDAGGAAENQPLDLPYWLESWQGPSSAPVFGATTGDSCSTQAALGQVVLADFTGDLLAAHFPTPPGTLEAATGTPTPTGVIRLPAPNHKGSALASLSGLNDTSPALPWLLFDWDGNGTPEAPAARATFGVYSGTRALIFRREVYR